jgi:hypothetical protein
MESKAGKSAGPPGCAAEHFAKPADGLDPLRQQPENISSYSLRGFTIVFMGKILARGFSLQGEADARMPPEKLGGTIRVVLEQKVFYRMPLVP